MTLPTCETCKWFGVSRFGADTRMMYRRRPCGFLEEYGDPEDFLDESVDLAYVRPEDSCCHHTELVFAREQRDSVRKCLDNVWEAGGKAWDDVADVDAAIREMRGDDDPTAAECGEGEGR